MSRGADFSDIQPRDNTGTLSLGFQPLSPAALGVDVGEIAQVTPNNSFRLGQQVMFWLGISNPIYGAGATENYITRVRLKLWWARPNMEYRQAYGGNGQPGATGALGIDKYVFGEGPLGGITDNRYVWVPSPKRLDITQFQTPPPPASPPRTSDSLLLDDCWTMDLQSPTDPTYTGKFGPSQEPSRWVSILYPAFGYALGWTYEIEEANQGGAQALLRYNLSWSQGTFGASGRIQESVG